MKTTSTLSRLFCLSLLLLSLKSSVAQVNLPYTLHFASNDAAAWSDGVAQDGDGGTQNINGIDIQVFAATSGGLSQYPGATMMWKDNTYYSSGTPLYNGITPGPDPDVTMNGIPAVVIKSSNTANNFSLTSIKLYDWGGVPTTKISAYNDGLLIGSVNVSFDQSTFVISTLNQPVQLPSAIFSNIDEVRFTPVGSPIFWLSMNDIGLSAASVVPVTLSSFLAIPNGNNVALKWKTEQEVNSDHFDIEESQDGKTFSKIGVTVAKGHSSTVSVYEFLTSNLRAGTYYYRLKSVDADGTSSYSKILTVAVASKQLLSVYPNPASDQLGIDISGSNIEEVRIVNLSGLVISRKMVHSAGTVINIANLPKATYLVEIVTKAGTITRQFIKQ